MHTEFIWIYTSTIEIFRIYYLLQNDPKNNKPEGKLKKGEEVRLALARTQRDREPVHREILSPVRTGAREAPAVQGGSAPYAKASTTPEAHLGVR